MCGSAATRGWGEAWQELTFCAVVFFFGAAASLPPLALQDLQSVVLLELQDGQRDLIPEWGAWAGAGQGLASGPALPQPSHALTLSPPALPNLEDRSPITLSSQPPLFTGALAPASTVPPCDLGLCLPGILLLALASTVPPVTLASAGSLGDLWSELLPQLCTRLPCPPRDLPLKHPTPPIWALCSSSLICSVLNIHHGQEPDMGRE